MYLSTGSPCALAGSAGARLGPVRGPQQACAPRLWSDRPPSHRRGPHHHPLSTSCGPRTGLWPQGSRPRPAGSGRQTRGVVSSRPGTQGSCGLGLGDAVSLGSWHAGVRGRAWLHPRCLGPAGHGLHHRPACTAPVSASWGAWSPTPGVGLRSGERAMPQGAGGVGALRAPGAPALAQLVAAFSLHAAPFSLS